MSVLATFKHYRLRSKLQGKLEELNKLHALRLELQARNRRVAEEIKALREELAK